MSYTEGPWNAVAWKHGIFSICAGDNQWVLAETSGPNSEADARLIAAAPDLLSACLAIIADPYGCPFCDSGELRNPAKDHNGNCAYVLIRAAIEKAGQS